MRNKIVEINRSTEQKDWMFVRSKGMVTDIASQRFSELNVTGKDSV